MREPDPAWVANYNRSLKVDVSANEFFQRPSSFRNRTLEQLQKFLQGTFQNDRVASPAAEKGMWRPIVNKGDECVDSEINGQRRSKCTYTSNLLVGCMEEKDSLWTEWHSVALDLLLEKLSS